MICPNCGRELPDTARVCPSCTAVQQPLRRRRQEADVPETPRPVRVERSVLPDERAARERREQARAAGEASTPSRRRPPEPERSPQTASRGEVPVGLLRQQERDRRDVRRVRRAPDRLRRKLDAGPALLAPPIYQRSHKRLLRILLAVLLLTLFAVSAGGYMLFNSEGGQRMMAQWGWDVARTDAYVTLGRELYGQAYYERALEALNVAIAREPENVDALVLMGQTYTELGDLDRAIEIYRSLIEEIAPAHPSAYRNLIRIYQQQGLNAEALELMRLGSENSGTQEFDVMLREYTPTAPTLSHQEGRYSEEIDVTISIPEGETVYYTTDGTDPSEAGTVYTKGTKLHIPEGKMTVKAIGFTDNGTPSEQVEANFTVIIPTPAAPKANYASGVYKTAPKVRLRPGSEDPKENAEIVAIYYTIDGRVATTDSILYNDDEPIQLPIGNSTLRAIAVARNGKISYEMNVTYKVEGNLKKTFSSSDTFKNLELYSTGYNTFKRRFGEPESYEILPAQEWYSLEMESWEAVYDWGTARFCKKQKGSDSAVLYALDTTSASMTGPRSTKVGMKGADVMGKFQDLGQAALDDQGNRLLYNISSETLPAGLQFGSFRREADGRFAIHYYYPADKEHTIFVELSYYLDDEENVERIVWQRYRSELTP